MAAPKKDGLSYFSLDTDFYRDERLRSAKRKFGAAALALYVYILGRIFGSKGYYLPVDDEDDFFTSIEEDTAIGENSARQILNYLCKRSLLDGTLFTSVKALTSVTIQMAFQEVKKSAKREFEVDPKIWLLNPAQTLGFIKFVPSESFSEKNGGFSENNHGNSENNAIKESKGKKREVKESKGKTAVPPSSGENADFILVKSEYGKCIGKATRYIETELRNWLTVFDKDVIIWAIREAARNNAGNWSYINAILTNHNESGRRTLAEIRNASEEYRQRNKRFSDKDTGVYKSDGTDYAEIERLMNEKY